MANPSKPLRVCISMSGASADAGDGSIHCFAAVTPRVAACAAGDRRVRVLSVSEVRNSRDCVRRR